MHAAQFQSEEAKRPMQDKMGGGRHRLYEVSDGMYACTQSY